MNTKPFKGSNVFMSRKLVPPELFDSLHDALKLKGADVFLCCDPSRNSPNDFHVISSPDHEKFEDLRAKGCNLLGPQCVLSCAKERRALPKLGFVCCLAMDGVKVLASGFEPVERAKIEKLVVAMAGRFHSKASSDISFVIVKNVMAGKYKWAASKEKHIVTISWLYQCWNEHRVVPVESYRAPPFFGLIICVTRIPADERKEMEKLIIQNGGKYSAELTKICTHLICEVSEGDKFKVAQRWGNIRIVTRKWFDQSIARRVCLNEEAYPVQSGSTSRSKVASKSGQNHTTRISQSVISSAAIDSSLRAVPSVGNMESDMDIAISQNFSSAFPDFSLSVKKEEAGSPNLPENKTELEGCVADDSEDDNDLYLSDCRICFIGFEASDMRKLVGMVRKGGGSRYMSWSERLTHVVVGAPSDVEKKELRGLAALGVIRFVKRNWLEDCDRERKEVPVIKKHIAYYILLPKGLCSKGSASSTSSVKPVDCSTMLSNSSIDLATGAVDTETSFSLDNGKEDKTNINGDASCLMEGAKRPPLSEKCHTRDNKDAIHHKNQLGNSLQCVKSSNVFVGKLFCFSPSFPEDRKDEVVQWITEGGGEVADDPVRMHVNFTVECHGVMLSSSSDAQTTCVSSHWVRSCLEDGSLLEVGSHILYSPLPCQTPLPGFKQLRFCVSQYMDKERLLLRNLCFVLGAKFVEKLTKKVTHLLCKFANGPKYEAACRWGIQTVTCEWLYECVRKDDVVAVDNFFPNPQDPESGVCPVSQYPTQAGLISGDNSSQFASQTQDLRTANTESSGKRLKFSLLDLKSNEDTQTKSTAVGKCEDAMGNDRVPDVASAIEDLLEQTSKIQDLKSPTGTERDKNIFSSDCPILGRNHTDSHSAFGPSRHWLSSLGKKDDPQNASRDQSTGIHDGFSETQTDSQLVGYEEDLSGRQMIIDRVRTRSSMT